MRKALVIGSVSLSMMSSTCLRGQTPAAQPLKMRLCIDSGCQTLTWVGDHYDGYGDGDSQIGTRYWLTSWSADHVELSGKTSKAVDGIYPAEGIFTATIAPGGENVVGGVMAWRVGYDKSGKSAFTLTWGKRFASNTAASTASLNPKPLPAVRTPAASASGTPPKPVESIVDIEVTDPKLSLVPPPAPQWHPLANPLARFDLNGTWERDGIDHPETISVFQFRDVIVIRNLQGRPWFLPNASLASGKFTASGAAKGVINVEDRGDYVMHPDPAVLNVRDAEHLEISDDLNQFENSKYHRLSQTLVPDVPCDVRNPAHVSSETAFAMSDAYFRNGDVPTMRCWAFVSATLGNADAGAVYGESLLRAEGADKRIDDGAYWIQSSAMHGSVYGALLLSNLFNEGVGLPQSNQRSLYWRKRYLGLSDTVLHNPAEHDRENNAPQPWMSDTVTPCDARNPSHVDGEDALKQGRVAYQARAMQKAHCWFLVSSHQGNIKAYTYLGIMSAFGMGVRANPENGFAYLFKAAKEQDADAAIFLANFYRYGVGTAPDDNQARSEMQYAMNLPHGMSAFSRLEGSLVNSEATDVLLSGSYTPDQNCIRQAQSHPGGRAEDCYDAGQASRIAARNNNAVERLHEAGQKTILDNLEEIYPEARSW